MNFPAIVWCIVAGMLLCAFIFRAIERYFTKSQHSGHDHRHLFEIGKEKDIFFIPGDIDDDEFDDL